MKSAPNPVFHKFNASNWRVLDALLDVSKQIGKPPAQVALNWVVTQPGVTSTILGATKVSQLDDNFGAIEFTIPPELRKRLNESGAPEVIHPYLFFGPAIQPMITGGVEIERWTPERIYETARVEPAAPKAAAAEK